MGKSTHACRHHLWSFFFWRGQVQTFFFHSSSRFKLSQNFSIIARALHIMIVKEDSRIRTRICCSVVRVLGFLHDWRSLLGRRAWSRTTGRVVQSFSFMKRGEGYWITDPLDLSHVDVGKWFDRESATRRRRIDLMMLWCVRQSDSTRNGGERCRTQRRESSPRLHRCLASVALISLHTVSVPGSQLNHTTLASARGDGGLIERSTTLFWGSGYDFFFGQVAWNDLTDWCSYGGRGDTVLSIWSV